MIMSAMMSKYAIYIQWATFLACSLLSVPTFLFVHSFNDKFMGEMRREQSTMIRREKHQQKKSLDSSQLIDHSWIRWIVRVSVVSLRNKKKDTRSPLHRHGAVVLFVKLPAPENHATISVGNRTDWIMYQCRTRSECVSYSLHLTLHNHSRRNSPVTLATNTHNIITFKKT